MAEGEGRARLAKLITQHLNSNLFPKFISIQIRFMHLRIDSHSGFAEGPAPPARDSSRVISGGYADCPCNLSYENTSQSQRTRSLYLLLNDDLGLSQIPYINQNSRMHIDPHISQPTECRPNPFMTFALSHTFTIAPVNTRACQHSPSGDPTTENASKDPGMRSCSPRTLVTTKLFAKPTTTLIS